jgi:adenylyltransferase/sulfurtransferase
MDKNIRNQYSRFMLLNEVGIEGQKKLFNSRIGIFGFGGLGTWSALLCSQIGVGFLRIIDRDVVEISNLPRTPLFTLESVDLPKVEEGAKILRKINPQMTVESLTTNIDEETINELIEGLDVVIDGLDTFRTRYIINQACFTKKIPYVFAGGLSMQANLSTFTYKNDEPCLNCIFSEINDENLPTCETAGVHTSLLAITASLQVAECIRIITNKDTRLRSKIAYFDLINFELNLIPIEKNQHCKICGDIKSTTFRTKKKFRMVELCGSNSFMVVPKPRITFDIKMIRKNLKNSFKIIKRGELGITFAYNQDIIISIFKGGNILIRGVKTKLEVDKLIKSISTYLK